MILFVCNASSEIGMGHLVRCGALAWEWSRLESRKTGVLGTLSNLCKPPESFGFNSVLGVPNLSESQVEQHLLSVIFDLVPYFVVCDSYSLSEMFYRKMYESGIRFMQFDGFQAKRLWADYVLNQSPEASSKHYDGLLVNQSASLLLGPYYAVLREQFRREAILSHRDTIVFAFGGGGDRGATIMALEAIKLLEQREQRFAVMVGHLNPNRSLILKRIRSLEADGFWVDSYFDPPDVWGLFQRAKLAIVSGGGILFELSACRVPSLVVSIAQNQQRHGIAWGATEEAEFLGDISMISAQHMAQAIKRKTAELECPTLNPIKFLVDGLGVTRVIKSIERF